MDGHLSTAGPYFASQLSLGEAQPQCAPNIFRVAKEIKSTVVRVAEMNSGDVQVYMKLIQTVMANGMGMEPTLIKKPAKVRSI